MLIAREIFFLKFRWMGRGQRHMNSLWVHYKFLVWTEIQCGISPCLNFGKDIVCNISETLNYRVLDTEILFDIETVHKACQAKIDVFQTTTPPDCHKKCMKLTKKCIDCFVNPIPPPHWLPFLFSIIFFKKKDWYANFLICISWTNCNRLPL